MGKLRIGTKAGYGIAEIGASAVELLVQVYLLEFYVSAGLDPLLAGIALAIAVIWDAISDPLMGSISDRTRAQSARGRRLSYLAIGTIGTGLAIGALFSPSGTMNDGALFLRLLGWYLVLNTALTLFGVPYLALVNDIARRSQDRSELFGWRMVFSGVGLIAGLSAPLIVESWHLQVAQERDSIDALLANRNEASYWIGLLSIVTGLTTFLAMWGVAGRSRVGIGLPGLGALKAARVALASPSFRNVVGAFTSIAAGRAVNASLALIFYKQVLELSETQVAQILITLSLVLMGATPLWIYAAKRVRKSKLCWWGSAMLAAFTAIVYPLMPVGQMGPAFGIAIAGGCAAASVVLLESLFSDIVEADSNRSNQQLSGSYYGLWRMATKIARAIGLGVAGLFLWSIGFEEGIAEQTTSVERSIAWGFGPGVALFFFIGAWLIRRENQSTRFGENPPD